MPATQLSAVIGHPIGHTLSPFLHERLFALRGVPARYRAMDVPDLAAALPDLRRLDCFNVTIPHKRDILPYLDGIDGKALACGSVNAVRVREGKFYGATTDGEGCFRALVREGLDFSGDLLLLGNGGAARAIAFEIAARRPGFALTIACREPSRRKAEALAGDLARWAGANGPAPSRLRVLSYGELAGAGRFDLLLNATSVGMAPQAEASPVNGEVVARCAAVFDAVYNPAETRLLRLAKEAGAKAVGGLSMLVYQAVAAHRFWYGWSFRDEDVDQLIRDAQARLDGRGAG